MDGRYSVVKGSQTGHCCFEATVIDNKMPCRNADGELLGWFEPVCECFTMDEAEAIAMALNLAIDR